MERTTESVNNVRTDRATSGDYNLTFTITEKTTGLETINVTGTKNGIYSFSINHNVISTSTGVNFIKDFDFAITQLVMDEIEVIKGEYTPEA